MSTEEEIAKKFWDSRDFTTTTPEEFGIKKVIDHGLILREPNPRMSGTTKDVVYVTGSCYQLDQTHCIVMVGTEEQGGGDLCVGSDAFVFEHISDIKTAPAIPLNRIDTNYQPINSSEKSVHAKFPMAGTFIPLGAKLEDGSPHPAAGTGFGLSPCVPFALDKTSVVLDPESLLEMVQLRWDGKKLSVSPGVLHREFACLELGGDSGISQPAL